MNSIPNYDAWKTTPPEDTRPIAGECKKCGCELHSECANYEGDFVIEVDDEMYCEDCGKEVLVETFGRWL